MQKGTYDIIVFLAVVSLLIITMLIFIVNIIYLYRKKQLMFGESIQALRLNHEKEILNTRLEIQEQTFQHISREIHDNINLSLTLAKLNLNTIDCNNYDYVGGKIESSIQLLTKSIAELSDISKALNADLIIQQGLIQAIEEEVTRIQQASSLQVTFSITGEPVFLNAQKELIIFRIIQEAFNNIIKHAHADSCSLLLYYNGAELSVTILDNGCGFDAKLPSTKAQAGLKNMYTRSKILGGAMDIKSETGAGTTLKFTIPYQNNGN